MGLNVRKLVKARVALKTEFDRPEKWCKMKDRKLDIMVERSKALKPTVMIHDVENRVNEKGRLLTRIFLGKK